jgi:hypothetical protein
MDIKTQKLPADTSQSELEKTYTDLVGILQIAEDHISKTDRVKSITVKGKAFTLMITPNEK